MDIAFYCSLLPLPVNIASGFLSSVDVATFHFCVDVTSCCFLFSMDVACFMSCCLFFPLNIVFFWEYFVVICILFSFIIFFMWLSLTLSILQNSFCVCVLYFTEYRKHLAWRMDEETRLAVCLSEIQVEIKKTSTFFACSSGLFEG